MQRAFARPIRALTIAAALCSTCASAYDWTVDAHVTVIQPSSVGALSSSSTAAAAVYLMIDASVGNCTANSNWLYWARRYFGVDPTTSQIEVERQLANTRAILSTLQLAMTLGYKVRLHGFNASSGYCQLEFVTALNAP